MAIPNQPIYDPTLEPEVLDALPPKKKTNKTVLIIIIVVAVLLLCCCLALIGGAIWMFTEGGYQLDVLAPFLRAV